MNESTVVFDRYSLSLMDAVQRAPLKPEILQFIESTWSNGECSEWLMETIKLWMKVDDERAAEWGVGPQVLVYDVNLPPLARARLRLSHLSSSGAPLSTNEAHTKQTKHTHHRFLFCSG